MITVTETDSFIREAEKLMAEGERIELVNYLAAHPEAGDIIAKTGGVRKLRFARKGQGKSGSYRVIYYYYDLNNPIYLFTVFGKNERANISDAAKNELYKIVQELKKEMKS